MTTTAFMEHVDKNEERFASQWRTLLPEDEISRQQAVKERLQPGTRVRILGESTFLYAGMWDTMHSFYPEEDGVLDRLTLPRRGERVRRDLRGRSFLQLPYTLLADFITEME